MTRTVKFLKKGIKVDGKYFPVWYSKDGLFNYPAGTITITAKDYTHIPDFGIKVHNDSDGMTDYFETDCIRVVPDHPLYSQVAAVA